MSRSMTGLSYDMLHDADEEQEPEKEPQPDPEEVAAQKAKAAAAAAEAAEAARLAEQQLSKKVGLSSSRLCSTS